MLLSLMMVVKQLDDDEGAEALRVLSASWSISTVFYCTSLLVHSYLPTHALCHL